MTEKRKLRKAVKYLIEKDEKIATIVEQVGWSDIKPGPKGLEAIVNIIIGQQLSIQAARTIRNRFYDVINNDGRIAESIIKVSKESLRNVGLSNSKIKYIIGISNSYLSGELNFEVLEDMEDQQIIEYLTKLKGIGRWTAEMYLMFSMNRLDVFPLMDKAIISIIAKLYELGDNYSDDILIRISDSWRPYRSVACWILYSYTNTIQEMRRGNKLHQIVLTRNPYS